MSQQTIFVYGSFTQGLIHNTKIDSYVTSRQDAYIYAHAYLLDVGYPAVVTFCPNSKPQLIHGEVLTVTAPDLVHKILDDFHGLNLSQPEKGLHFKQTIEAQTAAGAITAAVYVLNPTKLPKTARLIEDGNWKLACEKANRVQDVLTAEQVSYMRKLAAVKGRQSHPYDLTISRELMKLEIVVDKGRRLSLTRLGKDILRYLPE